MIGVIYKIVLSSMAFCLYQVPQTSTYQLNIVTEDRYKEGTQAKELCN